MILDRLTARLPAPLARSGPRRFLLLRYVCWAFALLLGGWALVDPRFRTVEGGLQASVCLPLAGSLALLAVGWGVVGRWRAFAAWLGLALVGQAALLQLIDAGPLLRYQHLKPPAQMLAEAPLAAAVVLFQALIVGIGLWSRGPSMLAWLRRHLRAWQLVAVALLLVVASAAPSRDLRFYGVELILASLLAALNLATLGLMFAALPASVASQWAQRAEAWLAAPTETSTSLWPDRFAWLVALWVLLLTAALSLFVYEAHPHVQDEVAYLAHARFLANGALTLPAPPVREAFDFYLMEFQGDQWYPSPPPGWPLLLALGVRLGVPWLVNPLLAALNVLLAYALLRDLYDRRFARLALLLLAVSPWYLFMGMNLMTHTATLTCALAAALGVVLARRTGQAGWGLLVGVGVGMVALIRPLEGACLAAVLGLWMIGLGGKRVSWGSLAMAALGGAVVVAASLAYNKVLTGSPLTFPINAYTDKMFGAGANALGFGPNRGAGWPLQPFPGHSPAGAAVNALLNTFALNVELFGWAFGSLLFAALFVVAAPKRRSDYLMLAVIAVIFGVHIFYWFSGGPDFGARYWYLMIVPLVVLTVRGLQWLEDAIGRPGSAALIILVLGALSLVTFVPWRALDKYHHYLNMRPDVRMLAQEYAFGRSLVLIQGDEHPDYASAAIYNPLDFSAPVPIYARDRDAATRERVLQAYADRPVWVVAGPTLTGQGYRVTAGPVSAQTLLDQPAGGRDSPVQP